MADEQKEEQNKSQEQNQQPTNTNAKERLKELGFIDMTKPGAGIAFIGGVRRPRIESPKKAEVPDNEQE